MVEKPPMQMSTRPLHAASRRQRCGERHFEALDVPFKVVKTAIEV